MPGHAVGSNEQAIEELVKDHNELEELIKEHDVIYLLTDSRESRWLPTVIA
jgi:ubiquitin-like modifier-activating enzyme ATG7